MSKLMCGGVNEPMERANRDVIFVCRLENEAAAEAEDDHLKADFSGRVDRFLPAGGRGVGGVEEDRVLQHMRG